MTDTRNVHAVAIFWNTGDREPVGSYETGREAQAAAKAWIADRPDAKEVFIFNRTTPLFSVHGPVRLYR